MSSSENEQSLVFLGDTLTGLTNFPINRVAEFTPTAWDARKLIHTISRSSRPCARGGQTDIVHASQRECASIAE